METSDAKKRRTWHLLPTGMKNRVRAGSGAAGGVFSCSFTPLTACVPLEARAGRCPAVGRAKVLPLVPGC